MFLDQQVHVCYLNNIRFGALDGTLSHPRLCPSQLYRCALRSALHMLLCVCVCVCVVSMCLVCYAVNPSLVYFFPFFIDISTETSTLICH